jgi:hypothetical protein
MTNASAITASPLTASQGQSARWRFRVLYTLIGFYLFIAFAAPILTDDAGLLWLRSRRLADVDQHWLYACMILIGGWVAVGPHRIPLRALQGLIGIGWLLLAWLLGLTISPNWKSEFEGTTLACLSLAVATFLVLIMVRFSTGRKLVQTDGTSNAGTQRFQYSITMLLLVMLLICVTVALWGWIDPKYRKDATLWPYWHSISWRKDMAWGVCNAALGPLLISAAYLPVFWGHRKWSLVWALGLSACALIVLELRDEYVRTYILFPLLQGKPHEPWVDNFRFVPHIANMATVSVCLLTAAAGMHWLGYRISAESASEVRKGTLS